MDNYIESWDNIANEYSYWLNDKNRSGYYFTELVSSCLLSEIQGVTGKKILDLGCGEGYVSRALREKNGIVFGIDASQNMIKNAKQKSKDIEFIVGDITKKLPYIDQNFDLVVCNMVLMDIDNLLQTYSEVYRVLSRGGEFIYSIVHPCFEGVKLNDGKVTLGFTREKKYTSQYTSHKFLDQNFNSYCTNFHRPIQIYINNLIDVGFEIRKIIENNITSSNIQNKDINVTPLELTLNNLIVKSRKT